MMRIKTIQDGEVRKLKAVKVGKDARITLTSCPVFIVSQEEIKVVEMMVSKETYIKEMRKFLEELEA